HSTLDESFQWFPFYQTWAKQFRVLVPTHPGFGQSEGFDRIDTIEDMAFHYVELFDALGLEEVALGGVSLGGWIAAEVAVRWPERGRGRVGGRGAVARPVPLHAGPRRPAPPPVPRPGLAHGAPHHQGRPPGSA